MKKKILNWIKTKTNSQSPQVHKNEPIRARRAQTNMNTVMHRVDQQIGRAVTRLSER